MVPYYLASLWDGKRAENETKRAHGGRSTVGNGSDGIGRVPKALRQKLKKSRGAKGLLQDLEEEVRKFVQSWEERKRAHDISPEEDIIDIDMDSSDDEVVFVGRDGSMRDRILESEILLQREKLLFYSLEDDQSASFG
jgi:hypothetical protein